MSWRNTDRAFGSRMRGLRGLDGLGASHGANPPHPPHLHGLEGLEGLEGWVPPLSIPTQRWRNTDQSYGNRPKGLPFSGFGLMGLEGLGDVTIVGFDTDGNPIYGESSGSTSTTTLDTSGGYFGVPAGAAPAASPSPAASGSTNWPQVTQQVANIGQAAFNDAFKVLQLLNPVPPGTTITSTPYGTSISRSATGAAAVPSLSLAGGSSSIWILLAVGVGALVLFSKGR